MVLLPPYGGSDVLLSVLESPRVDAALAAARGGVDRLLGARLLRTRSAEVAAESALRGARASAALDGVDRTLITVRGWDGAVRDDGDRLLLGSMRVSAGVHGLAAVWGRAPLQALARLHVLAAAGAVPADALGRPRTGGPRLAALARLVTEPATLPAAVEAALIHGELLTLSPFGYGNGIVARAASRLVLAARGLDPQSLAVPEVGHAERGGDYRSAAAGYASGSAAGLEEWLLHCATALELGSRESLGVCGALLRRG